MALSRSVTDRRYYEKRKDELLGILGRECVKCGSTSDIEFDHIDPSTKSFKVMQKWNFPMEVLIPEIAKCQPLCSKCHKEKTAKDNGVGHGEGLTGKRNCYCDLCRAKKNEYSRNKGYSRKISSEPRLPALERLETLHGTRAGYMIERRHKIPTCDACRAANTEYTISLRRRKASLV